jgi:hypothetical protein
VTVALNFSCGRVVDPSRLPDVEDGPEGAEGTYEYAGRTYRIEERDSERWRLYDGDHYVGQVIALPGTRETAPKYTPDSAGEEDKYDEPATDDWRLVLESLIDNAAPPVGA